jgi:peptidoglycan/LPS O-acetylase OafA/YrhL
VWKIPAALAKFFASYSYSLYLVHNTVLVIVFENTAGLPKALSIGIGVVLAHAAALLIYYSFEKHHRAVGTYLRPIFVRNLMRSNAAPGPESQASPAVIPAVTATVATTTASAASSSDVSGTGSSTIANRA